MKTRPAAPGVPGILIALISFCIFLAASATSQAEPKPAAISAFNGYVAQVEARLANQHRTPKDFLAPADASRLRTGDQIIEQVPRTTGTNLPGAMLHHWRGTAFASGATAADFERLMKDFPAYPKVFAPQVETARILTRQGDHLQVLIRTRQKHVITVVLDTAFDITFGRLDPTHGYSLSRSTDIKEIDSPGTPKEKPLGPKDDHGFLWRLNT